MGDELKKHLEVEIEYLAGSGGVFEISLDGKELFSKRKSGRFPEAAEIIDLVKNIT